MDDKQLYLGLCDVEVKLRICGEEAKYTYITDEGDGLSVDNGYNDTEITEKIRTGWINQLKKLINHLETSYK